MTVIKKTNERQERTDISNALTSVESDVTTLLADVAALQASVTALEAGVNGKPPTELKGIPTTRTAADFDITELTGWIATTSASTSTYDSWTTVLEETSAEGVIQFLAVYQLTNASSRDTQARLSVDGTVVWTSASNFWAASTDNEEGAVLVGAYTGTNSVASGVSLGALPFTTSFKLDFKKTENATGTVEVGAAFKYQLTG